MENIIKLKDFNTKSLDDIIELYRSGYILEDTTQPSFSSPSSPSIQKMDIPSYDLSVPIFLAGLLGGLLITLLLKGYKKKKSENY